MSSHIRKVRCCNFDIDFLCTKDAANFFNINYTLIYDICNERLKNTLYGIVFMYIN